MERIQSFSIQPGDKKAYEEIQKLKDYSKKTGISFSFLILKAIVLLNKDLKL